MPKMIDEEIQRIAVALGLTFDEVKRVLGEAFEDIWEEKQDD